MARQKSDAEIERDRIREQRKVDKVMRQTGLRRYT